jgi:hypothetical protein
MRGQPGFFDIDDRLKRLSDLGDQLEAFRSAVDFELFRPELNATLSYTDRTEGRRPPFDPVLMFKILVIQATNNLSDERAEFLINDRLSFYAVPGTGVGRRGHGCLSRLRCRLARLPAPCEHLLWREAMSSSDLGDDNARSKRLPNYPRLKMTPSTSPGDQLQPANGRHFRLKLMVKRRHKPISHPIRLTSRRCPSAR